MENDGMGRFEDGERVEWVMDSIRRGMNDTNVVKLYQVGIFFTQRIVLSYQLISYTGPSFSGITSAPSTGI